MRNSTKHLVAIVCAGIAGTAFASSAVESLAKIEEETLILKAREKQLTVKAQIAAKEAELATKQADTNRRGPLSVDDEPVVRSIEGIGQTLYATLHLSNGSTVDVSIGDVLPNGMKVISIRPNEVTVQTEKKHHIRLSTGAPATNSYAQAEQRNSHYMPPLPSMPPALPIPVKKGYAR